MDRTVPGTDPATHPYDVLAVVDEQREAFVRSVVSIFDVSPEDAEDLVQEVSVKAWQEKWRFVTAEDAFRFLRQVAINSGRSWRREEATDARRLDLYRAIVQAAASDHQDDLAALLESRERFGVVLSALRDLPEKNRRVFLMRHLEGIKPEQIARSTGYHKRHVEWLLRDTKSKLGAALRRHDRTAAPGWLVALHARATRVTQPGLSENTAAPAVAAGVVLTLAATVLTGTPSPPAAASVPPAPPAPAPAVVPEQARRGAPLSARPGRVTQGKEAAAHPPAVAVPPRPKPGPDAPAPPPLCDPRDLLCVERPGPKREHFDGWRLTVKPLGDTSPGVTQPVASCEGLPPNELLACEAGERPDSTLTASPSPLTEETP